ncbi:MAG: hypothetical protein Q9169_005507 [Polycauliona sp. 2 TL-2023]
MALSPRSSNVKTTPVDREIDAAEQIDIIDLGSRSKQHSEGDYTANTRHGGSISDLPFRTIEWGHHDIGPYSSSTATRPFSPFQGRYEHRPIYAPTPLYTPTDPYSSTPRYIPPFTTAAIPSYVLSPSAPSNVKRRSKSCCFDDDDGPPTARTKVDIDEEEDEKGKILSSIGRGSVDDRRASAPGERHLRRSSDFESWRKRRKDQKRRLELDAVKYEAEQEALFSASRGVYGPTTPMPGDEGETAVKREPSIKKEQSEEE